MFYMPLAATLLSSYRSNQQFPAVKICPKNKTQFIAGIIFRSSLQNKSLRRRFHLYYQGILAWLIICLLSNCAAAKPAQQELVIYANTSDSLKSVVSLLQTELNKARIPVRLQPASAFSNKGILLRTGNVTVTNKRSKEAYRIEGNTASVTLTGASVQALQHAVFHYLYLLGYRYYFPNSAWHIIPQIKTPYLTTNITTAPDFFFRRIWYGYASGSEQVEKDYAFWIKANRLGGEVQLETGHAYDVIAIRNKEAFKKNPAYTWPAGAELKEGLKFNVANEGLVQLCINDALQQIGDSYQRKAPYTMLSMEPSDGPGICDAPECRQLGTPSDRVFYLINRVAKVVQQKYPGTWIGSMAYSDHQEPPTKPLEPNVFVMIVNGFNTTKYTTEELVQVWSKKASALGVYDYFSVYEWDFDMPGQGKAPRIKEMSRRISNYKALNVKAFDAESTMGSVSRGLGQYIASQLLWDGNADIEALKTDFFLSCFGKAAAPMRELFESWENYPHSIPVDNDMIRWYEWVEKAAALDRSAAVQQRLQHIKIYLHYVTLYRRWFQNKTETSLTDVISYMYRINDLGVCSSNPAMYVLSDKAKYIYKYEGFAVKDENAKWKYNKKPVNEAEINAFFAADKKTFRAVTGFKPQGRSASFKNISHKPAVDPRNLNNYAESNTYSGTQEFVLRINKKGAQNFIEAAGGYVSGGGGKQAVPVQVFPFQQNAIEQGGEPLLQHKVTTTASYEKLDLSSLAPGLYSVVIRDPGKMCRIRFSGDINYSIVMSAGNKINTGILNYFYAYVPKGTTKFLLHKDIICRIKSPSGRDIDLVNNKEEIVEINVGPGEDGFWLIHFQVGKLYIEGIPPYLGIDPAKMLLPE
jgi:uncharacterized protein (DUF2164 family)